MGRDDQQTGSEYAVYHLGRGAVLPAAATTAIQEPVEDLLSIRGMLA